MNEIAQVRQQVQQARAHIAKGELHKARGALKGLTHPKAQALLADVEAQLAQQQDPRTRFPLVPVLVFISVVFVAGVGALWALRPQNPSAQPLLEVLPTFVPTTDCTPETVRTWWVAQNTALDTFTREVSAASRTLRGVALDERLATLRRFRAELPSPPECASVEFQVAFMQVSGALDQSITAITGWADGNLDGLAISNTLYSAEQALMQARHAAHVAAGVR